MPAPPCAPGRIHWYRPRSAKRLAGRPQSGLVSGPIGPAALVGRFARAARMRRLASSIASCRAWILGPTRAVGDDVRLAGEQVAHEVADRVVGRRRPCSSPAPACAITTSRSSSRSIDSPSSARARGRLLSRWFVIIPFGNSDGHADAVVGELLAQHVAVAGHRELRRDVRALARARCERGDRRREHDVARGRRCGAAAGGTR